MPEVKIEKNWMTNEWESENDPARKTLFRVHAFGDSIWNKACIFWEKTIFIQMTMFLFLVIIITLLWGLSYILCMTLQAFSLKTYVKIKAFHSISILSYQGFRLERNCGTTSVEGWNL